MWRWVVGLWLGSRVAVIAAGVVLTEQLGWHRSLAVWQVQPWTAVTGWDTAYYIKLSHDGYHHGLSVAFFPLFPALMWLWREVIPTGDAITAMAVSNGAALIAMFGMYVLARDRLSEDHARRALLYLVLSPYAFALVFAYSEGIFLALTVWMFVLSDRFKDRWAIPLAFLTGMTRITGAGAGAGARDSRVATKDGRGLAACGRAGGGSRRARGVAVARRRRPSGDGEDPEPVGWSHRVSDLAAG